MLSTESWEKVCCFVQCSQPRVGERFNGDVFLQNISPAPSPKLPVPRQDMVAVHNPFVVKLLPQKSNFVDGATIQLSADCECVVTSAWAVNTKELNSHIGGSSGVIEGSSGIDRAMFDDRSMCAYSTDLRCGPCSEREITLPRPDCVDLESIGTQAPRKCYPLVVLIQAAARRDLASDSITGLLSVVHLTDSIVQSDSHIIMQYLILASGRLYRLQQLYSTARSRHSSISRHPEPHVTENSTSHDPNHDTNTFCDSAVSTTANDSRRHSTNTGSNSRRLDTPHNAEFNNPNITDPTKRSDRACSLSNKQYDTLINRDGHNAEFNNPNITDRTKQSDGVCSLSNKHDTVRNRDGHNCISVNNTSYNEKTVHCNQDGASVLLNSASSSSGPCKQRDANCSKGDDYTSSEHFDKGTSCSKGVGSTSSEKFHKDTSCSKHDDYASSENYHQDRNKPCSSYVEKFCGKSENMNECRVKSCESRLHSVSDTELSSSDDFTLKFKEQEVAQSWKCSNQESKDTAQNDAQINSEQSAAESAHLPATELNYGHLPIDAVTDLNCDQSPIDAATELNYMNDVYTNPDQLEIDSTLITQNQLPMETQLNSKLSDSETSLAEICVVCQTNAVSHVLLPCRHSCICRPCFNHVNKCPICRADIRAYFVIDGSSQDEETGVVYEESLYDRFVRFNDLLNQWLGFQ